MGKSTFIRPRPRHPATKRPLPPPPRRDSRGMRFPAKASIITGRVSIFVENSLGAAGMAEATLLAPLVGPAYQAVTDAFGALDLGDVSLLLSPFSAGHDGTGGAEHNTCADPALYVDACYTDQGQRSAALFVAELIEVAEALQAGGWDCGQSHGEGLSRVGAEAGFPGALDDYSTAGYWLDGGRSNYVDSVVQSDTDDPGNGCSVLFLWWLITIKGYTLPQICGAAAPTLAGVYAALGETGHAWDDFLSACDAAWPTGTPSGVTTDNPWRPADGPPPDCGLVICLDQDTPAGVYCLVPQPAASGQKGGQK